MYDLITHDKRCRAGVALAEEGDSLLPSEAAGEIPSKVSEVARQQIDALLTALSPPERNVVRQYFGLDGEAILPREGSRGAEQKMFPPLVEQAIRRLRALERAS